jgi:hypothetical protein
MVVTIKTANREGGVFMGNAALRVSSNFDDPSRTTKAFRECDQIWNHVSVVVDGLFDEWVLDAYGYHQATMCKSLHNLKANLRLRTG